MIHLLISIIASTIVTFFSTAVMGYIAMATPIGPWIAPTLVLMLMIVYSYIRNQEYKTETIALVTASGSIGGIVATACGFSFPTLYFVDPDTFNQWMAQPVYFAFVLGGLALCAGAFGLWIADLYEYVLLQNEDLSFPIGQLVYKMIAAGKQIRKSYELMLGFVSSLSFSCLQDGLYRIPSMIPKHISLLEHGFAGLSLPSVRFDLWPLLWAVGFVAGPLIALPLVVGACTKIFIIDPINTTFFNAITNTEFSLAFCSGMVIAGACMGFLVTPRELKRTIQKFLHNIRAFSFGNHFINRDHVVSGCAILLLTSLFLTYFGFSWLTQLYIMVTTFICTYQIMVIAGKIGLAQLGRWATFVMVPALFLFDLTMIQVVFIATFVEISGGIAADALFGRKVAQRAHISQYRMRCWQYIGLIITALCIGIVFWAFINHLHLGSEQLFAQRAQARQLLIHAQTFDFVTLCLGFIFGFLLKFIRLNPLLVLGGILMPLNITLGLLTGALFNYRAKDHEIYIPFWSGVFAAGSVWMLIRAFI